MGVEMKIEILGSGCPKCKMLEEKTRKAIAEMGIKTEILSHVRFKVRGD
jgi:phage FluMu protein Com